jgi:4-carboxymuconolactone decarboxylase
MTTTERVAPLPPDERDARQSELVRKAGAELSVYTTLVRHPDLFGDFLPFGRRLLRLSTLAPRERELLIMRTAFRCRAVYEWSHHDVIGRAAGLDDADLDLLSHDAVGADGSDPTTLLLVRAADELLVDHALTDATWAQLAAVYTVPQVIEICMLVGEYAMLAGALNSTGVQIEDGYPIPLWAEI